MVLFSFNEKNLFGYSVFLLATHHLNKTIEVTRVNLFNIATQYKAIFNDDEHSPLAEVKNQNVNHNVIFFSWINDKVRAQYISYLLS